MKTTTNNTACTCNDFSGACALRIRRGLLPFCLTGATASPSEPGHATEAECLAANPGASSAYWRKPGSSMGHGARRWFPVGG
jgi:hypothetical protein